MHTHRYPYIQPLQGSGPSICLSNTISQLKSQPNLCSSSEFVLSPHFLVIKDQNAQLQMLHGKKDFNDGMMYFVSVFWHLKNYTDSSSKGSIIKGQDFKAWNDHIFYITGPIWMNPGRLMDLVIAWPKGLLFTARGMFIGLFGWCYYAIQKV